MLRVDPALEVDTLDMCSVKPILPRSEVFNTYGSLSNAELISRYGFVLPENEHDIVRLGCGSFATLINRLIILVHPSPAGGNDADIHEHLRVRYVNKRRDVSQNIIIVAETLRKRIRMAVYRDMSHVSTITLWDRMIDILRHLPSGRLCGAFPADVFASCKTMGD
jgi:hypothetical protein